LKLYEKIISLYLHPKVSKDLVAQLDRASRF
jgi:hypothetical protein